MPPLYQVDAFTDQPFTGNPAAVCVLKQDADPNWMQKVAAEMNLAETAFVSPRNPAYHLRWFTPTVEVDLCGHATLATAHVLWESGHLPPDAPCVFQSKSGELRALRIGDRIQLDFPATPVSEKPVPAGLEKALGAPAKFVGMSKFDYLVEVETPEQVRNVSPDLQYLLSLGSRGVIVTAQDPSDEFDFVSRFFCPAVGVDEDPVTGSAHCALGPYWKERLGKTEFRAWQASSRGGGMEVSIEGERAKLLGQAVTVFAGELNC